MADEKQQKSAATSRQAKMAENGNALFVLENLIKKQLAESKKDAAALKLARSFATVGVSNYQLWLQAEPLRQDDWGVRLRKGETLKFGTKSIAEQTRDLLQGLEISISCDEPVESNGSWELEINQTL
jgi:hypothetical protein